MVSTKTLTVLVVLIGCTLFAPSTPVAARTPAARVWGICKSATNPVLCYKTILPQAVVGKFNIYKALMIEILATKEVVDKVTAFTNSKLAAPGVSKSMQDSLSECKNQYSMMLDAIALTGPLVAKRNVGEAKFKFSGVLSYREACDSMFEGEVSPIANDSQAVFDHGANVMDIMKAIENKEARRHPIPVPVPVPVTPATGGGPCQGVIGICS